MQHRTIGDRTVSEIGLGGMPMSIEGRPDEARSIATIHADSPTLAIEQLILMIMQADLGITREQIKEYVESVINVVIQLKRGEKGRRYVSEIYYKPGK